MGQRISKIFSILLIVNAVCLLNTLVWIFIWNPVKRRKKLTQNVSKSAKLFLKVMGFELQTDLLSNHTQNKLIVCNHMSYMDIFILSSIYPTTYITSVEMKRTPVLGWICMLAGCLFTERRKKFRSSQTMRNEIQEIASVLHSGQSMTVFPEGGATNGEKVLPFKTPLFESAIETQSKVLPICFCYLEIDGEKFGSNNRDLVAWHDSTPFHVHFWRLCGVKKAKVHVYVSEALSPMEYRDRYLLGKKAHSLVSSLYFH